MAAGRTWPLLEPALPESTGTGLTFTDARTNVYPVRQEYSDRDELGNPFYDDWQVPRADRAGRTRCESRLYNSARSWSEAARST